jgi:UDP-N-acetylmuramate dehydrogenase
MPASHCQTGPGRLKTQNSFSLQAFNSFGVQAEAENMCELESLEDINELSARSFKSGHDLVLGGGSNILFASNVPGTVYLNRIKGRTVVSEDDESAVVDIAAGENWHECVLWSLDQGFCGIENLSLIPGLCGAAPMQNIGAYGVEISKVLESVTAYDWQSGETVIIPKSECGLSYRDSRFKSVEPDRFLILSCRLRLSKIHKPRLGYSGLLEELAEMSIEKPTAQQVSDAIVRIRQRKLPDPSQLGNAGSFFKNPELSPDQANLLHANHDGLPIYQVNDQITKISAAWMIEQCGWKGFREGDSGVSENHALVLVNYGKASGADLLELSKRIKNSVHERYGIALEREPKVFEQSF